MVPWSNTFSTLVTGIKADVNATQNDFQRQFAPQRAAQPIKSRTTSFALRIVVESHPV